MKWSISNSILNVRQSPSKSKIWNKQIKKILIKQLKIVTYKPQQNRFPPFNKLAHLKQQSNSKRKRREIKFRVRRHLAANPKRKD